MKTNVVDLTGKQFSDLTVIKKAGINQFGTTIWECKCVCGTIKNCTTSSLNNKQVKSCGCHKVKKIIGQKFGRLTVLEFIGVENTNYMWKCQCDCGNFTETPTNLLKSGWTKSCGCLRSDTSKEWMKSDAFIAQHTTHGYSSRNFTPAEYQSWMAMNSRCNNPNAHRYEDYGGRGITICSRWQQGENGVSGFGCFLADMGPRPRGYSIDRYPDVNGNYEPSNCRWATAKQQANNKRNSKK